MDDKTNNYNENSSKRFSKYDSVDTNYYYNFPKSN